jgi:hypothetical protein
MIYGSLKQITTLTKSRPYQLTLMPISGADALRHSMIGTY